MSSASSTFASGGSPTAAQVNGWAQGTLGYAQVVVNQTGIVAPTDLAGLTVTVTLVAGRRIKVTGSATLQNTSAATLCAIRVQEGATVLRSANLVSGAVSTDELYTCEVILTPTAGAHTYKVTADRAAGTVQMSASSTLPAFILVEDIGAV